MMRASIGITLLVATTAASDDLEDALEVAARIAQNPQMPDGCIDAIDAGRGPEGWLIVAILAAQGHSKLGIALEDRLDGNTDHDALRKYARSRVDSAAGNAAAVLQIIKARRAHLDGQYTEALSILQSAAPSIPPSDVLAVLALEQRAACLRELGDSSTHDAYVAASARAAALGWRSRSSSILRLQVMGALSEDAPWLISAGDAETLRLSLNSGSALVLYRAFGENSIAFVATPDSWKLVPLESTRAAVSRVCSSEWLSASYSEEPIDELRRKLVEPLGLDSTATKIIIAPQSSFARVPFCLLFPDRNVTCVPGLFIDGPPRPLTSGEGRMLWISTDHGSREVRGEDELLSIVRAKSGHSLVTIRSADSAAEDLERVMRSSGPWEVIHARCGVRRDAQTLILSDTPSLEIGLRSLSDWDVRARLLVLDGEGTVDIGPERHVSWHVRHASAVADTKSSGPDGDSHNADKDRDAELRKWEEINKRLEEALRRLEQREKRPRMDRRNFIGAEFLVGDIADRVLVTLWSIDREPRDLFLKRLYGYLVGRDGLGIERVDAAVARAREDVRRTGKWGDPRHWAAWQLWGSFEKEHKPDDD